MVLVELIEMGINHNTSNSLEMKSTKITLLFLVMIKEHQIENPRLEMAFVKFPDTGDLNETQYSVSLEPEHGGTKFSFYYSLDGEFIEMDY